MIRIALIAAIVAQTFASAAPALAETPLGPQAFEDYVTGKTLYFSSGGVEYGVEQYLRDRRVRWSFLDGQCQEGHWYPRGQEICFAYEDRAEPQCWRFFLGNSGLRAQFAGSADSPTEGATYETRQGGAPVGCTGPMVGV